MNEIVVNSTESKKLFYRRKSDRYASLVSTEKNFQNLPINTKITVQTSVQQHSILKSLSDLKYPKTGFGTIVENQSNVNIAETLPH